MPAAGSLGAALTSSGGAALGAGAIGGITSLVGAGEQSSASRAASQEQLLAEYNAMNTQVAEANEASSVLAPYTQIGTGALNNLANIFGIPYAATGSATPTTSANGVVTPGNVNAAVSSPGGQGVINSTLANFSQTPNYQFAFDQGLQALQRSAAAGGTLMSGGQTKAATEFGQGLASQQFNNYVSQLTGLAGMGQGAATSTASNALNAGNSIAGTQGAEGQSAASGTVGSAAATATGLNGVSSSIMNSLLLSKLGGQSPSAYQTLSPANQTLASIPSPDYQIAGA